MDRVSMNGRLGFSLDVSRDEFQVLTGADRVAARELLVKLVQSEQCTFVGDTYFPVEWNEEALAPIMEPNDLRDVDMEPYLEFDLPVICPAKQHARTLDLLNTTIDSLIEDAGYKPREVVWNLLDRGFTADELIELKFNAEQVCELAAESGGDIEKLIAKGARKIVVNTPDFRIQALMAVFEEGQRYFEKNTNRYFELAGKAEGANDIWVVNVFDENQQPLHNTTVVAGRLAREILWHDIVPVSEMKNKGVSDIIEDAAERSVFTGGKDCKDVELDKV